MNPGSVNFLTPMTLSLSVQMTLNVTFLLSLLLGVCVGSSGTLGLVGDLPEGTSDLGPIVYDCEEHDDQFDQCQKDKVGYEAIVALHTLIDDDKNGNVDLQESDEFLRDELQMTDGHEKQQKFHGNDKLVTVDDLWRIWRGSEVYNWTVDDVLVWLDEHVDLPEYSEKFRANNIDGQALPRLACNKSPFMSVIGINNIVHKQKLFLKAMDLVLFGTPKKVHNYVKDVVLLTSLVVAIGGCWFAYMHHRYSQQHVQKLMKDLESLQKAEEALQELQEKLHITEGDNLSSLAGHYQDSSMNNARTKEPHEETAEEISRFKIAEAELEQVRSALRRAEKELEHESKWSAPSQLQCWLQYTFEVEQIHFNAKRHAAELQLQSTKENCERIKKRNKAFFGSLRMAHSTSLDDIDQQILNARASLAEVKNDLQERLQRWSAIEQMCGFPIMTNPGMPTLKQLLEREVSQGQYGALRAANLGPVGVDDADEDLPPSYPAALLSSSKSCNGFIIRPKTFSVTDRKCNKFRSQSLCGDILTPPKYKTTRSKSHHTIGLQSHKKHGMGSQGSLSRVGLSRVNHTNGTSMTPESASPNNGHGPVLFNLGDNTPSPQPDLIGQMVANYHNNGSSNFVPSHGKALKHSQSYDLASSASESSLTSLTDKRSQSSSALKHLSTSPIPEDLALYSDNSLKKDKKKKPTFLKMFKSKVKK
ncbi:stromal interaction molecule 1 isoform X1 [Patella vulgata]|uniref:stromal interaction molecule 1 isoform X1 n=1 Tax=Patella vulgata TaxID=6465 RepID=UPI0021802DA1|nr:stromal interaction molecule 1 isoform X1 [Patella vulgata]